MWTLVGPLCSDTLTAHSNSQTQLSYTWENLTASTLKEKNEEYKSVRRGVSVKMCENFVQSRRAR